MPSRRNTRRKPSKKHKRTAKRRQHKQRGGGFSYTVPNSAMVEFHSLDDDGTSVPVFVTKKERDIMERDMDRA
jgi:hypothetical protein